MRDADRQPTADGLDEQYELVRTMRPRRSRGALLLRGGLYGLALLLTTSLGALAMYPGIVSYADPLLGENATQSCPSNACCAAKHAALNTPASTSEVACPGGVCHLPVEPASDIDLAEAAESTGLSGALSNLAPAADSFSSDEDPFADGE